MGEVDGNGPGIFRGIPRPLVLEKKVTLSLYLNYPCFKQGGLSGRPSLPNPLTCLAQTPGPPAYLPRPGGSSDQRIRPHLHPGPLSTRREQEKIKPWSREHQGETIKTEGPKGEVVLAAE